MAIIENPAVSPQTLDRLKTLISAARYNTAKQRLNTRLGKARPTYERLVSVLQKVTAKTEKTSAILPIVTILSDASPTERRICAELVLNHCTPLGIVWPLQRLLATRYLLNSDVVPDEAFSDTTTSIPDLLSALPQTPRIEVLTWILQHKDATNTHGKKVVVPLDPELLSIFTRELPARSILPLPKAWLSPEAIEYLLTSSAATRNLVYPADLTPSQFTQCVAYTKEDARNALVPNLGSTTDRPAAPREYVYEALLSLKEAPDPILVSSDIEAVCAACASPDDELFTLLTSFAAVRRRYLIGDLKVQGLRVFPTTEYVQAIAPNAWSGCGPGTPLDAQRNGAPRDHVLTLVDAVPGAAPYLLDPPTGTVDFIYEHLYTRIRKTNHPTAYVLAQLHAHPEVSLQDMCRTLSLQDALITKGL
jgi:hypothetical protein